MDGLSVFRFSSPRFGFESAVELSDFSWPLFDREWRFWEMDAGYCEVAGPVVHFDVADLRAGGQCTLDEYLGAAPRGGDLGVAIQERDDLVGPGLYVGGFRVATLVEVDSGVRVTWRENESDASCSLPLH